MTNRIIRRVSSSIVAKLWLTIVAMVVLVLLVLTFLLQQFFSNYIYQSQTSSLRQLAVRVQQVERTSGLAVARRVAQELATVEPATIAIASSPQSIATVHSIIATLSPSEQKEFQTGQPVTVEHSTRGTPMVSVYALSGSHNVVEVGQRTSVLQEPLVTMRNLILFAMGLGILLATGLAFVISKNLSRPLLQMNEVAEEMARGNFGRRIEVVTHDEVGRLGRTFNTLTSDLADTIQTLSMERDQLSGILSSLEDGVLATNADGHITLANPPAVRRLTSLILAETGVAELTKLPEDMTKLQDFAIARATPVTRETNWQGRHMMIHMTPLYETETASLRGIVFVLRDITEERRLDRLRKDFIANVSHELRTPLSMMQGYTEALLDEFGDDPEQRRELTAIIHDETLRMRRLVNSLLDLAQLESGQFQMNFADTDLAALVRWVTRKFYTLAHDRGIRLKVEVPDEAVVVQGDADRLEQVFTNLIDNALRHTQDGGTVTVDVSHSERYANVRVADTGTGIPEEDLPYIWERFYKADKARTRKDAGIGLGLPITRHIVLEHHGDVIVESELSRGTRFTVALPLSHPPS
ncbi:sensor histidine kinase [Alicyclobacillus sp. ALC3]|uniref:sensor histidine kinase n=1 Tax=Alicyclobacillus sp. ALC3 TaxID=2796143 RepID=UPI0023786FC0|nr:ATP-binding protein [Alicyclobacillus sp. ALC3]